MSFRRQLVVSSAAVAAACVGATRLLAQAQAPVGTVTGRVVGSAAQAPLVGARVTVVGTGIQVLTRDDGRFTLPRVPVGARRVRVALVGYAPLEQAVTVTAGGTAPALSFALQNTAIVLSQVVAIGYGTQRRGDLTGSVASVQSSELQQTTVNSVEQGLQGRVPGVVVQQGDAAPGGGVRVQVRGINSPTGSGQPLYVVDGVPYVGPGIAKTQLGSATEEGITSLTETNPLATIPPEDIASVDILKDASATAIYGSRGANGVVIITTKRGRRDQPGRVTLNASQGVSSVVRKLDVLNAYDYAQYVNRAFYNASHDSTTLPYGGRAGTLTPAQMQTVQGAGVNWQNLIYHNAPLTDVQLGFTGGDERGSYGIFGNTLNQSGVIRGSAFDRSGLRANFDRSVTDRIRVSTNLTVSRSRNNMVRTSTATSDQSAGIVRGAVTRPPLYGLDSAQHTVDPRVVSAATFAQFGSSPLSYTTDAPEHENYTRGLGNLRATTDLSHGFALDLSVGGNSERRDYSLYYPTTLYEGNATHGEALVSGSNYLYVVSENLLRYTNAIGRNHRVDAVAGYTYERDHNNYLANEVRDFPSDQLAGNVLQNGLQPLPPTSGTATSRLASWLGRVNYALLDRYLFTATVRTDGSSRFAAANKWATFPSVAFAWRASDEPFLKGRSPFNDLKLRLSYGKSGNQAIGNYQSLAQITGVTTTLNEGLVTAAALTQLGNDKLRWETTSQYDAGVDFGAFNNRVTATVDVYKKNTYDLLQQITLADNTGFSYAFINSGSVTNRGVEFLIGADVLRPARRNALGWNVSFNAAHNRNRVVSLGPVAQQFSARLGAGGGLEVTPFIERPGLPIGAIYGYKTAGVFRTQAEVDAAKKAQPDAAIGEVRYVDVNGDGSITSDDRTVIGDANPSWTLGLTNRFTFGRFDVSGLVTSVKGNSIINAERIRYLSLNGSINVPAQYVANSFDPVTNPNGTYPMAMQTRGNLSRFSDLVVEDGSFVRLKNVQLGYNATLPRARTARFYVNGINLLTHTRYTGYDPEVSAFGAANMPGVDQGSYPQSRVFTFGVNTSF